MSEDTFKTWAVVEVMGHVEFAGYVQQENIAGVHMLRIDVPQTSRIPAFTKYISPSALYGITPCSEETARARAESQQKEPFNSWDVGSILEQKMVSEGRLLPKPTQKPSYDFDDEEEHPF